MKLSYTDTVLNRIGEIIRYEDLQDGEYFRCTDGQHFGLPYYYRSGFRLIRSDGSSRPHEWASDGRIADEWRRRGYADVKIEIIEKPIQG